MCPTRYCDTSNPPTNTSPLNSPSLNTSLSPSFPSLPFTHTLPPPLPTINHSPPHLTSLNAALINARSLRNNIPNVISLMTDNDLYILFTTETWLSPLDPPHIAALNISPYCFIHNHRYSPHPGGGTVILYKSSLTISNISYYSFSNSEALSYTTSSPFSRTFNISLFYRPTSPNINLFLDEFNLFLPTITSNTFILGDFNIPNPPMIQSLNKLLTSFNIL